MRGCFVRQVVSNQFSKHLGHRECCQLTNILNAPQVVLCSDKWGKSLTCLSDQISMKLVYNSV